MANDLEVDDDSAPRGAFGWKAMVLTLAFQTACLVLATFPSVTTFASTLPDECDSLQHLWVMRWYKTCLTEGRSVFLNPEIQYPTGAPLGNFSPLHFQAMVYVPLSVVIKNDVLCYNLMWTGALLLTGLGTSLLVWHVLGDRPCAAFGGLLAMLTAPMLAHSHGHLELITVGWFPLFLVGWMRFVDRPSRGRLAAAVLGYVLVAMSAAYYMVFAVFPAVLYVAWAASRGGRKGVWPWLRGRGPWFAGMIALTLPCLLVLFSSHLWAIAHGYPLNRSREEFDFFAASLLGYVTPTTENRLSALLPMFPHGPNAVPPGEGTPYLGVVTALLLAYAAVCRAGVRRATYLWSTLVLLVVLSLGSYATVGSWRVSLPAAWLWDVFPPMRLTRAPSRFALFAGVVAGVLAAAGLRHLLARLPGRAWRASVFALVAAAALADLSNVPYWRKGLPEMPRCYAWIKQRDPHAALLEIPYLGSGGSRLNAACTYWQARHRLTTSAGYSGHRNMIMDQRVYYNSPFLAGRLAQADYLEHPEKLHLDMTTDLNLPGYAWLYMTANKYDYIVLHQWKGAVPEFPVRLERLKTLLQDAKVYEDSATVVYARSRLKPPTRPMQVTTGDWQERNLWDGRWNALLPKAARFLMYSPDPDMDLSLILHTAALRRSHSVRLLAGTRPLAGWVVEPGRFTECLSPPFRLPAGVHELTIESESRDLASLTPRAAIKESKRPYHLRVARVAVVPASYLWPVARRDKGTVPPADTKTR